MGFAKVVGAVVGIVILSASAAAQDVDLSTPQDWSDLTKAATIEAVSDALAEINKPFAITNGTGYPVGYWGMEQTINDAIIQMVNLRDTLSSNPYVRVSSFTVGFPWGVSVEFSSRLQSRSFSFSLRPCCQPAKQSRYILANTMLSKGFTYMFKRCRSSKTLDCVGE